MDNRTIRYNNVRYLVDLIGGVSNFAEKIGKGQSQVSQFAGTNPIKGIGNKIAREIEAALQKDHGWLDVAHPELWESHGDMRPTQSQSMGDMTQSQGFVPPAGTELIDVPHLSMPVISWVQAGDWTPVMASDLSNVIEWLPYDPRAGKNGFGLVVKGASMEPVFRADDRIYVNPTYQIDELNTGDLVVMACDGDCEATFKELVVEGGRYYLRALNPNWHEKIMPVDHNCRLVGKVVGRYTIF